MCTTVMIVTGVTNEIDSLKLAFRAGALVL